MKIKSVLAALAAAATVSAVSVCGFAEAADSTASVQSEGLTPASEETAGNNPETGIEGVAAVAGTIVLAGAAVALSRKKN